MVVLVELFCLKSRMMAQDNLFPLFLFVLDGQDQKNTCAHVLFHLSRLTSTYIYIYICLYIYIYIYLYLSHVQPFLLPFCLVGRNLATKRKYFCFSLFAFLSSLCSNFPCTINAHQLLYFLLAYKVKSCWPIKIIFPPFFQPFGRLPHWVWGPLCWLLIAWLHSSSIRIKLGQS